MTRATVWTTCFLAFAIARSAEAGTIVFSVSGIRFDNTGFGTDHTPLSVAGVDTPQHSGVTVNGAVGGFNWFARVGSSDPSNWYLNSTSIIIESLFSFSGSPIGLQPGDIPAFSYVPIGRTFPFAMSIAGPTLTFAAPVQIGIDPRLAAFYGLAPPCPALLSSDALKCVNPSPYIDALLTGTGTPVSGSPGVYNFDARIDAVFAPEPPTASLGLVSVVICAWIAWKRRHPSPILNASATRF